MCCNGLPVVHDVFYVVGALTMFLVNAEGF